MLKVYFAGPDVFYPDYDSYMLRFKHLCFRAGIEPLFPTDNQLDDSNTQTLPLSKQIFNGNIELIRRADAVIANLNPFRSRTEPDSGTAFECGMAFALGKIMIGYIEDQRSQVDKIGDITDQNNASVENFNLSLNLMLAHSLNIVATVEEAILLLRQK